MEKVKIYWAKGSNTLYVVPPAPYKKVTAITSKGKTMKTKLVPDQWAVGLASSHVEVAAFIGEL